MKKRIYSHVAVIGIDGMGAFCRNASTPNFSRIFKNGCMTIEALSMAPTVSAQNWGAMLLGAKPSVHAVTNENINLKHYSGEHLPSLFRRIKQEIPGAKMCSYVNWSPINMGLIEDGLDVETDTDKSDESLCGRIVECVREKPDFLFVQFDEVDGAGHKYTYGSQEHLAAISREDGYVGRIYDEYCNQGIIDDTLFIVITDHGGFKNGHGGFTDEEKYIFFGAAGKTVIKGSMPVFMQTRDISAIVLYALGIDVPEYEVEGYSSQVPAGVFSDYDREYIKVVPHENIPETKDTPGIDGKGGLYEFFEKNDVEAVVDFDGSIADRAGKHTIEEQGAIKYYSNGVRGSYGELGMTGSAKISDLHICNGNGFSASFWVKINTDLGTDNPPIFADKSWEFADRKEPGFCIFLCGEGVRVHIGLSDSCSEVSAAFPEDVSGGWVHTIISFDCKKSKLRYYYNFKFAGEFDLSGKFFELCDSSHCYIGNDGKGTYNDVTHKMLVLLDDFILFSRPLDSKDAEIFGKYYS